MVIQFLQLLIDSLYFTLMCFFFVSAVRLNRNGVEGYGQDVEDECLNEINKNFKANERRNHEKRHQEHNDHEHNLAGEDVPEKSEGIRDNLYEFTQKLNQPNQKIDHTERIIGT